MENKFSLICCTYNTNIKDLELFLSKLHEQTYKNFELLIVDQNTDSRLSELVDYYSKLFEIKYLKSEPGLSRSRNVALSHITGDIVSFPDDDCYYEEKTLEKVNHFFNDRNYDGVIIKPINTFKDGIVKLKSIKSQILTKYNTMSIVCSITMFFKSDVIKKVGGFDEKLGLGSSTILKGGEDWDYPLRAISLGYILYYENSIYVFHPWPNTDNNSKDLIKRAFGGGAAIIYLLNKHNFPFFYRIVQLIKRFLVILYFALIKRDWYRIRSSFLIFKGFLKYWNIKEI